MDEFSLINRFFRRVERANRADVAVGIGDDAAVLNPPPGRQLVATTDILCAGIHFPTSTDPESVGHKSAAVNISDLAAMGAEPAWTTLAITLPDADSGWLAPFCRGFFRLLDRCGMQLIGGDTSRGPLQIVVQAFGFVPEGGALLRSGARPGDGIFVTGSLGDAALALSLTSLPADGADEVYLRGRLDRPEPRIDIGRRLVGLASAAIDISDGLAADLRHILDASEAGGTICLGELPLSPAFESLAPPDKRWQLAIGGGDDYELCFTVPPDRIGRLKGVGDATGVDITEVGRIRPEPGLEIIAPDGRPYQPAGGGHLHFS